MGLILIHVGKRLEETETWNLKKNVEMIKMMKMSKNGQKCRKNVNKIGFDYI